MKRTDSNLQNECSLKGESDVITVLLRVKVSHIFNFGTHRHSIAGIALKFLRDRFAFWCLIQTKIKKIMNFFTCTLASAKFATVNNC